MLKQKEQKQIEKDTIQRKELRYGSDPVRLEL